MTLLFTLIIILEIMKMHFSKGVAGLKMTHLWTNKNEKSREVGGS